MNKKRYFVKMSFKKVGKKGVIIYSQGREIVSNVLQFMKKEAEGVSIPLKNLLSFIFFIKNDENVSFY